MYYTKCVNTTFFVVTCSKDVSRFVTGKCQVLKPVVFATFDLLANDLVPDATCPL